LEDAKIEIRSINGNRTGNTMVKRNRTGNTKYIFQMNKVVDCLG
jgi:hypothetical protein